MYPYSYSDSTPPVRPAPGPAHDDARLHCGACGRGLCRVRRRLPDRLVSLLRPVRRYACVESTCGWECTLGQRHWPSDDRAAEPRPYLLLDPSRMGPLR